MPCYTCSTKEGPWQRLNPSRIRFIRKVQPGFKANSHLCPKCFAQFDKIYRLKARNNTSSSLTISSAASTNSTIIPSQGSETAVQRTKDLDSSESTLRLQFISRSLDSDGSIDSTDRIVQMAPEILSLRDSSRKTTKNPELNIARDGAEAAVQSVLRRKREHNIPRSKTPVRLRRDILEMMDEEESLEDELEISSQLCPNDLAHTGPIVKRRKEPIVYSCDEIMDIYLAGTTGG